MLAALWMTGLRRHFASKLELAQGKARVTREVDAGLETLEVELPAVITTGPAPQRAALREAAATS